MMNEHKNQKAELSANYQTQGLAPQHSSQQALPKDCVKIRKTFRRGLNLLPRVN